MMRLYLSHTFNAHTDARLRLRRIFKNMHLL